MRTSDSLKSLAPALVAFQAEIRNPAASAENPRYSSRYTPLEDMIDHTRPVLEKHGLAVVQSVETGEDGRTGCRSMLVHTSGEWIMSGLCRLPVKQILRKGADPEDTAQGAGSATSYARRYSWAAILGIASDKDDDGNAVSGDGSSDGGTAEAAEVAAFIEEIKNCPDMKTLGAINARRKEAGLSAKAMAELAPELRQAKERLADV